MFLVLAHRGRGWVWMIFHWPIRARLDLWAGPWLVSEISYWLRGFEKVTDFMEEECWRRNGKVQEGGCGWKILGFSFCLLFFGSRVLSQFILQCSVALGTFFSDKLIYLVQLECLESLSHLNPRLPPQTWCGSIQTRTDFLSLGSVVCN